MRYNGQKQSSHVCLFSSCGSAATTKLDSTICQQSRIVKAQSSKNARPGINSTKVDTILIAQTPFLKHQAHPQPLLHLSACALHPQPLLKSSVGVLGLPSASCHSESPATTMQRRFSNKTTVTKREYIIEAQGLKTHIDQTKNKLLPLTQKRVLPVVCLPDHFSEQSRH